MRVSKNREADNILTKTSDERDGNRFPLSKDILIEMSLLGKRLELRSTQERRFENKER